MIDLTTGLSLPQFTLDCRDWIVAEPAPSDEPVLAALSTLLLDDDVYEASGTLSVCVIEDDSELDELEASPVSPEAIALEVPDIEDGMRRFVMPGPAADRAGRRLSLLVDFQASAHPELHARIDALMTSFCWA